MVSDQTLRTDLWNDIRTVLVSAAIQSTIGSTVKSASIVAAYNDQNNSRPQIIIYPINPEETLDKFSTNEGRKDISVQVDCYSNKSLGADQIAEQATHALKNAYIPGVDFTSISSDYAFELTNDTQYHLVALSVTYRRE